MSDSGAGNKNQGKNQNGNGRGDQRDRGDRSDRRDGGSRPFNRGDRNNRGDRVDRGDSLNRPGRADRVTVEVRQPSPPKTCPICQKPIFDISSSIIEKNSKEPAHFDCVMQSLVEAERPGPTERVAYIGSGNFAVVENDPTNNRRVIIKRKIQYEEKENKPEWRAELDQTKIR